MVTMTDKVQFLKDANMKLLVLAPAAVAAAISAFVPVHPGIAVPVLVFLSVASLAGLAFAWRQAEAALAAAQRAETERLMLANRLIRIEQQLQMPAANPALRSTMAEVTGKVGLLGGVVRELAKNVAAQNRDVADLKDTLKGAPKPEEPREDKPVFRIVPEPAPAGREASSQQSIRMATDDEMRRMRLVTQAFEADRIELHLQPIVALPQRKIRFYEALARLRLVDGTLLGPAEFLPLLERLGRAPEFDRRVLNRAMAVARHLIARGSEAIVGVNLSSHSVREPGFLWSLTGLVDSSPEILGKIVLELPQACWLNLDADQKAALATLRDRGVPMSLDRAADLHFDARTLADLGVRFMKLPADLMIAAAGQDDSRHPGAEPDVRDFGPVLRREGIKLIAERVEREEMVPALAELGVPLAQGFVFAAPRAIKAEVLGAAQQPASPADDEQHLLRRAG